MFKRNSGPNVGGVVAAAIFLVVAAALIPSKGGILVAVVFFGVFLVLGLMRLTSDPSTKALIFGTAAIICSLTFAGYGVRGEVTGETLEPVSEGRHLRLRLVTREESPKRFRIANNYRWGLGILFMTAGVATLVIRKRADDDDLF